MQHMEQDFQVRKVKEWPASDGTLLCRHLKNYCYNYVFIGFEPDVEQIELRTQTC